MRALLTLLLFLTSGCLLTDRNGDGHLVVGCVGDSNTQDTFDPTNPKWCEQLRTQLAPYGIAITNVAVGFTTWCDESRVTATVGLGANWPWALLQLPQVLGAQYDLLHGLQRGADVILAAFGTNDIAFALDPSVSSLFPVRRPRDIATCIATFIAQSPVPVLVATLPPGYPVVSPFDPTRNTWAQTLNGIMRSTYGTRVIDFDSGFTQDLYLDDVHLNLAGQTLRAERAMTALARAQ